LKPPDDIIHLDDDHAPSHSMGPRPRPPPIISISTLAGRRRPEGVEETKELDKSLEIGEELRVAVVVRMPGERRDEETGWENGMELGVWEGVVEEGTRRGWG
jgi:hypothetical protein